MRLTSATSAGGCVCSRTRRPTFIVQMLRNVAKPECISAAAQRAHARASAPAGHRPGWRSARNSLMPSESQTTVSPSRRQGTLPEGEKARKASKLEPRANGRMCSTNGMARARNSTQGRSDHDE